MASLMEAPLSFAEAHVSARERRKREKDKRKAKERKARKEERRRRREEDRNATPAQMAAGFLAWRDQQEIEGPDSWRDEAADEVDRRGITARTHQIEAPHVTATGTATGEPGAQRFSVTLRVETPPGGSGHVVAVTQWPFTIGRSRRCGLAIDDPKVSSEHCILFHQPGGEGAAFAIEDQSLSGVRVDGVWLPPQTRVPLTDGCRISLGKKGRHAFHFCVQTRPGDHDAPRERAALAESESVEYELADDLAEDDEALPAVAEDEEMVQSPLAESSRRQELLEPLLKHSWLPPCGGALCSMDELEHYNELLARSLSKRNRAQSEGCGDEGRQLRRKYKQKASESALNAGEDTDDKKIGADSIQRQHVVGARQVGLSAASAAAEPLSAGPVAWFEPLPRVKASWGESLASRPLSDAVKPWGELPLTGVMNLGDAWDNVLQALRAKDLCRLAASCRGMRRLVAWSSAWRSLYVSFSKLRPGVGPQEFTRLQMPPETWKLLYVNAAKHRHQRHKTKPSRTGSAFSTAFHSYLQCPVTGCGKSFKTAAALHDHLRGAGVTGTRQGPPHHTLVPDGKRHYCHHEFCPRYFPSAQLASMHTYSECKRISTRCLARRAFGEGHFVCSECQAEFRFQRAFNAHFITLDGNRRCPTSKDAMNAKRVAYEEPNVADARERAERCSALLEAANIPNGLQLEVHFAGGRARGSVTLDLNILKGLFHVTAGEAARSLGLCPWQLAKACKQFGLERWPHILCGFAAAEKKIRCSLVEQVTQFAASRPWPALRAPFKGVYQKRAKNASRPWFSKIVVLYRVVNLGDYHSQVEAAIAFDACMLAYGKPMKGRSSFVRPAQPDDLNLLSPLDSQPAGVQAPAAILETARKLVEAHKREFERAKLADSKTKGSWSQELADAEVSKARSGGTVPKPSASSYAAASGARKRMRDSASD